MFLKLKKKNKAVYLAERNFKNSNNQEKLCLNEMRTLQRLPCPLDQAFLLIPLYLSTDLKALTDDQAPVVKQSPEDQLS